MELVKSLFDLAFVQGILASLVVFFITEFIKRIRQKKQYKHQTGLANKEVFQAIRSFIPEEEMPSCEILIAIHKATAKRYNVDERDMDSIATICDDLVKEVMESNFLSYENKLSFCEKIHRIKENILQLPPRNEDEETQKEQGTDKEEQLTASSLLPITLSLVTFMLTFFLSIIDKKVRSTVTDIVLNSAEFVVPIGLLTVFMVIAAILFNWFADKKNKQRGKGE